MFSIVRPVMVHEIEGGKSYVLQDKLGRTIWGTEVHRGRDLLCDRSWLATQRALEITDRPRPVHRHTIRFQGLSAGVTELVETAQTLALDLRERGANASRRLASRIAARIRLTVRAWKRGEMVSFGAYDSAACSQAIPVRWHGATVHVAVRSIRSTRWQALQSPRGNCFRVLV